MTRFDSVFSLIDLGSFSSIWFWILLAIAWSNATHFILGIPFDMVQRARRHGGDAMEDLELMSALQARRRTQILRSGGVWLVGGWSLVLTLMVSLGFGYDVQLAQACALLLVPLTLVAWMGMSLAARFERNLPKGKDLTRTLILHRLLTQGIGLVAILITTMWGTWYNLTLHMFGG